MKKINVTIYVEEDDFCSSDLDECITDGFNNVGNHTLLAITVDEPV